MNNRNKLLSVLVLVFLLVVLGIFWWVFRGGGIVVRFPAKTPATVTKEFQVTEKVDYDGKPATSSAVFLVKEGKTALELLKGSHESIVKTYSFGSLVESIDGLANGTDKKYWIYYVNGQTAEVGADQYTLKAGDVVEWKFEAQK